MAITIFGPSREIMERPSLGAILLGLIPFAAICFSVAVWDRIYPMVLGLPFNLFWLLLWTFLSPLFLRAAWHLEAARGRRRGNEGPSE